MYSQTHVKKLRAVELSAWVLASAFSIVANASENAKDLGLIHQWLPDSFANLELVFSFDSASELDADLSAADLHKAIDRVGPTVVLVEARTAYDDHPRLVGGYNPYSWKDAFGRYEKAAGRFVFDLKKGRKWDRQEPRGGFEFRYAHRYGLAFGDGDLVINSDLRSGNARNATFATPPHRSALLGEATDFRIDAIEVYRVDYTASDALPKPYAEHWKSRGYDPFPDDPHLPPSRDPGRRPSSVPDAADGLSQLVFALATLALVRWLYRSI